MICTCKQIVQKSKSRIIFLRSCFNFLFKFVLISELVRISIHPIFFSEKFIFQSKLVLYNYFEYFIEKSPTITQNYSYLEKASKVCVS